MYDRILLATDGERSSEAAVEHAVELAAAHGATLHALYVVDADVYAAYSGDEYVDEHEGLEHALEEQGREATAAVTEAAGAETEVVEVIEHGTPADVVLEYADEADVDLLVLGTRQRPEAYRTLIGSVTDRVVRLADRPTLVVKTPHEGA